MKREKMKRMCKSICLFCKYKHICDYYQYMHSKCTTLNEFYDLEFPNGNWKTVSPKEKKCNTCFYYMQDHCYIDEQYHDANDIACIKYAYDTAMDE